LDFATAIGASCLVFYVSAHIAGALRCAALAKRRASMDRVSCSAHILRQLFVFAQHLELYGLVVLSVTISTSHLARREQLQQNTITVEQLDGKRFYAGTCCTRSGYEYNPAGINSESIPKSTNAFQCPRFQERLFVCAQPDLFHATKPHDRGRNHRPHRENNPHRPDNCLNMGESIAVDL
jgi:hypothetical protein